MKILLAFVVTGVCLAQTIAIVNSGSTNTAGFRIAVQKSGKAEYTSQPRPAMMQRGEKPQKVSKNIAKSLAERFYADVKAAQPLHSLPPPHCAKSASFGTRTYVVFGEEESPDLSCGDGGDPKLRVLIRDVNEIVQLFR